MYVCDLIRGTWHGKGVFDGIGGAIKNKVHSLIKVSKMSSEGVPVVEGGYITSMMYSRQ